MEHNIMTPTTNTPSAEALEALQMIKNNVDHIAKHPDMQDFVRRIRFYFPQIEAALTAPIEKVDGLAGKPEGAIFDIGDRVFKVKGSEWEGRIVGFYSTTLTPIGYAVESELHVGSVQIYPQAALGLSARLQLQRQGD